MCGQNGENTTLKGFYCSVTDRIHIVRVKNRKFSIQMYSFFTILGANKTTSRLCMRNDLQCKKVKLKTLSRFCTFFSHIYTVHAAGWVWKRLSCSWTSPKFCISHEFSAALNVSVKRIFFPVHVRFDDRWCVLDFSSPNVSYRFPKHPVFPCLHPDMYTDLQRGVAVAGEGWVMAFSSSISSLSLPLLYSVFSSQARFSF